MLFEWDPKKNAINIQKHGLDFNDVVDMFTTPMLVKSEAYGDFDEERWIGLGMISVHIAVVVYTERYDNVIRIISARKATKREKENYAKHIKN